MILEVEHAAFQYDEGNFILEDVNFSYETPQTLCILGSNGTGKSTLLKCILGENILTKGSVRIDGKETGLYSYREMARRAAYLAQTHIPSFPFPVIDVVMMGRTSRIGYFASPGKKDRQIAAEKLDYLNIRHLADKPYTELSGGERQMVMIASALAQEPELIIFDEPTSHLDFGNQFRFLQLVKQLKNLGIGVLMTTHFPDHALYLDCSTVILHEGKILGSGSAKKVITEENLSKIYSVSIQVEKIQGREICIPFPYESEKNREF